MSFERFHGPIRSFLAIYQTEVGDERASSKDIGEFQIWELVSNTLIINSYTVGTTNKDQVTHIEAPPAFR